MNSTKPILAGLVCALLSACTVTAEDPGAPGAPTSSETVATAADDLVEIRYRHGETELVAVFREARDDLELVAGPDDAAISELLNRPNAGVAEDPSEPGLFHIYTTVAEREAVQEALRQAPRTVIVEDQAPAAEGPAAPGVRTQSLCSDPAGCSSTCPVYFSFAELYRDFNLTGQKVSGTFSPSLGAEGFNDAASSLYVQNTAVTLFENSDFRGHSIMFSPDIEVRQSNGCGYSYASIPSLKRYTMISRWWWSNVSWNDQATSFILTIVPE